MAQSTLHETRTVMIVGKTGAGKSTVANAIARTDAKFLVKTSFSSVTQECQDCDVSITEENTSYRLRVIDTVGLFDTDSLKNEETIAELKIYLQKFFAEGINLIIFVLKEGRFSSEERATFDLIRKNFHKDISAISALVLTNCDTKNEAARSKIIQEFQTIGFTKPTAEFMKAGIYTVGIPSKEDMNGFPPLIKDHYEQSVAIDREKLWALVKQSSEVRLTEELQPVIEKYEREVSFWDRCKIL